MPPQPGQEPSCARGHAKGLPGHTRGFRLIQRPRWATPAPLRPSAGRGRVRARNGALRRLPPCMYASGVASP
eukprot:2285202-Pyramimonas_sp.AAC.1